MHDTSRLARPLVLVLLVAACSGGAASIEPATPVPSPASSIDPGQPIGNVPGDIGPNPGPGDALIVPKPGQLDPRPVPLDRLTARVDGRRVVITASWTSGVEPCYVLDSILVDKVDLTYTITLREGRGPGNVVCIEIAQMKQTKVDLGELEPGEYTIADGARGAAPIDVTVS